MTEPAQQAPEPGAKTGSAGDEGAFAAAKARDAGFILPIIGLILFAPPVIGMFTADMSVFGAPLIVAYLFITWAVLIVAAGLLSRSLVKATRADDARAGEPVP